VAARSLPGNGQPSQPSVSGGAIDHWSVVLFYSMGFGVIAVVILFFLVLLLVWMYAQFVWSFTQWDMANVRLTPFKSLAYLILTGTFVGGTCVGLWCFSGAAWQNRKPVRASSTSSRRTVR
jgi:hypothetical protein